MHFVTVGNYGFIKFLKNISLNFQQPYMKYHEIHIFCLGQRCFSELLDFKKKNKCSNVKLIFKEYENDEHITCVGKDITRLKPEYIQLNNVKFSLVADFVSEFDILHYIDSDIGFLKDPQAEYGKLDKSDIVFQSDVVGGSFFYPNQCAGNFLIRNTAKARNFISRVNNLCSADLVDQKALNKVLSSDGCVDIRNYGFADVSCFDPKRFPNGYYAFHQLQYKNPEVVCLHANYISGESTKIDALAVGGVWFMNGPVFLFFRKMRFVLRRYLRILKVAVTKKCK